MLLGNTPDDKLYRVQVHSDRVDAEAEGMYCSANELPLWLQERLAVLMMTDWRPVTEIVEDVGRRIDETTYWVVKPN